jgi:hypothetical protein
MPYTYTSLAFLWLLILGLFAVSASGVIAGYWLILLLLVALATPALVLRRCKHSAAGALQLDPVPVIAGSRRRRQTVSKPFDRSPLEVVGVDVDLWENEGGGPRRPASGW